MRLFHSLWLLLFLATFGCSSKPALEPVLVGHLVPLEGAKRTVGQHARQGVEQAIAESRDSGQQVAGRPFAVLHVDSGEEAVAMQSQAVRLVTVNKALALLADFDPPATAQLVLASRPYGVPVLEPGERLHPPDSDAVVSFSVSPAVRGRMLARYASADLKGQRAAVLTDIGRPIATKVADSFIKAWPHDRNSAIEEWTFTSAAERDERVARIIQANPAVIVLACSLADFRLLRPRLTSTLPKIPLIYGGEDAGAAALQAELETHPDVYLATVYSAEKLSDTGRAFARRYEERFHESPDYYAALSYDAARLLFDVMQRMETPSRDALVKELAQRETFESVTGPVRWKDRQAVRRVFLIALKNNRPTVVSVLEPEEN